MLWGNLYYVFMARKLAYRENRGDVCTMPYGINTPGACEFHLFQLNERMISFISIFFSFQLHLSSVLFYRLMLDVRMMEKVEQILNVKN